VASLHFAPTERAKRALLREGVDESLIHVTGNTGIDSLRWTLDQPRPDSIQFVLRSLRSKGLRPVLLTAHRRENRGSMEIWFRSLVEFLSIHPDLGLIYPIHPNHLAKPAADLYLSRAPQAHLVPPLNYGETCHLLAECDLVVTDSGGIQEEAATLGIPTIICRETTERMEAVEAGLAKLSGTHPDTILSAMAWALGQPKAGNPGLKYDIFGDGHAAERIADLF
ncbi:MAG: UDP-N-acetylglucosamine 2-epimerase (non-hydrolyzing), partial [Proteobacteria bacterium]|nr:UDP-N-acetylglucosamine 2-epimerase (non-hydrolyzing) [Pseudomonadota bacterium]